MDIAILIALVFGFGLGLACSYLWLRGRTHALKDSFQALSAQALQHNNQSFLDLAKTTLETYQEKARADLDKRQENINHAVKPVHDALSKMDEKIGHLEKAREGAYAGLKEQIHLLRTETTSLGRALRQPQVRGRWGEIQLRKVVEMAGMVQYCDFSEQVNVATETGVLRPDLVVHLPAGKTIVIDAKTPLAAFLEAMETEDENRRQQKLEEHAQNVHKHVQQLAQKSYWRQFEKTPEFVVLFLPGETFFSAALKEDPSLIEKGVDEQVILATPTTLIALLRAIHYGWRQEDLAENAQKISDLGRELYERLQVTASHLGNLGSAIDKSVENYNKAVGSLETRVLVSARKFKDLKAAPDSSEIKPLKPIESAIRKPQTPELLPTPEKSHLVTGKDPSNLPPIAK